MTHIIIGEAVKNVIFEITPFYIAEYQSIIMNVKQNISLFFPNPIVLILQKFYDKIINKNLFSFGWGEITYNKL